MTINRMTACLAIGNPTKQGLSFEEVVENHYSKASLKMGQRDNFTGGFLAGAMFGGIVGGVLGVLLTTKLSTEQLPQEEAFNKLSEGKSGKGRKRQLKAPSTEQSIEVARRGLEDKIAQLNDAIDDVRQQLGNVNGSTIEDTEQPLS